MKRREFITLLGSGAVAWPLAARAQQVVHSARIGVLMGTAESQASSQSYISALKNGLRDFGWIEGRNLRIDYRFSGGDIERMRAYAAEVVDLAPDVIVVHSNPFLAALRQVNRTIPAVFAQIADPLGSGFIDSLARPGGNITGFSNFEADIGGKWLEILKQIAPKVSRAAALLQPETAANVAFLRAAESASSSLGVTVTAAGVHDAAEIERVITAFASEPNGGLIVIPHVTIGVHRDLIAQLAARYGLPAVWPFRSFIATNGGLVSYGVDVADLFRRAAVYVDRILRGAKPSDLPVQNPTKYELVINLKTAKALGLTVPPSLLATADEVIE
jgi:putative tryptophan/tyrosine transport system substrate-binding protein